jgi:hypothetical protein
MKLLLFLLLAAPVLAHGAAETAATGNYTVELSTSPEQLEPGASTLIIHVLRGEQPVAHERVWLRLSNEDKIYFSSIFTTDEQGAVALSYYFTGPGVYELTVEVDKERAELPVHVHGQYMLIVGFLTAVFIVLALLLDRI